MKDEEMAEEYKHYSNNPELQTAYEWGHKDGFLAGLKAGRPQWHDLREDPNDLPNDKEYVLVYTNLTNYYVAKKVDNHFMAKGWGVIPMSTVIAWCEIPTFDKE